MDSRELFKVEEVEGSMEKVVEGGPFLLTDGVPF